MPKVFLAIILVSFIFTAFQISVPQFLLIIINGVFVRLRHLPLLKSTGLFLHCYRLSVIM